MVGGVATCCFVLTPTQAKAIDNFKEYFQPYESYDPYKAKKTYLLYFYEGQNAHK